jgi:tetratricopeptide (TPR) repeat protein
MSTQRRLDEFELNLLNTALKKCSAEALKFISPIISLDSVQKLLFSCLIENSRSLEEWIWEPKVRHIITQLRDQNPHLDASNNHLDLIYHKASDELSLVDSLVQQNEEDILKQVEDIRSEGKRKFQEENFYAAMNSFKKCIDLLVQYHNAEEDEENTFEPGDWSSHMRDFYVTCCCNIAICAIKLKQLSEIREFSSKVNSQYGIFVLFPTILLLTFII